MLKTSPTTQNKEHDHIVDNLVETGTIKETTSILESRKVYAGWETLERYPLNKLLALQNYLSDLLTGFRLSLESESVVSEILVTDIKKIKSQLDTINFLLNLPDEIPYSVNEEELIVINIYGFRTVQCKGRIYGHINKMTTLSRQCRFYLFSDLYFDLDLKNSHPSFLADYALQHCIKAEVLQRYVKHRETFLLEIMKEKGIDRDEAKESVLICLNLSSSHSLYGTEVKLHQEIVKIREHLFMTHMGKNPTEMGKYTASRKTFERKNGIRRSIKEKQVSLQSQYCQTQESIMLKILREVCLHKADLDEKVQLNRVNDTLSFIPFFDGAYVRLGDWKSEKHIAEIIADTNMLIHPHIFELKPIEPNWSFLEKDTLVMYEKARIFLGNLSHSDYNKWLKYFNIPAISLKTSEISGILENEHNSSVTDLVKNGECTEINELIRKAAEKHSYTLRKSVIDLLISNQFEDILQKLEIKPK